MSAVRSCPGVARSEHEGAFRESGGPSAVLISQPFASVSRSAAMRPAFALLDLALPVLAEWSHRSELRRRGSRAVSTSKDSAQRLRKILLRASRCDIKSCARCIQSCRDRLRLVETGTKTCPRGIPSSAIRMRTCHGSIPSCHSSMKSSARDTKGVHERSQSAFPCLEENMLLKHKHNRLNGLASELQFSR